MKKLFYGIILMTSLGFNSTSRADVTVDTSEFIQRSRLPDTWQFRFSLGLGFINADQNPELRDLINARGISFPAGISFSVYHPEISHNLHLGYVVESLQYKDDMVFTSIENNTYTQNMPATSKQKTFKIS